MVIFRPSTHRLIHSLILNTSEVSKTILSQGTVVIKIGKNLFIQASTDFLKPKK